MPHLRVSRWGIRQRLGDGVSGNRRLVDGVDGVLQCRVELLVGLLGVQTLGESTREACDEPVVVGEQLIGLLTGVPAGQGDDTHDPRIVDEVGVQVGLAGNRQLCLLYTSPSPRD